MQKPELSNAFSTLFNRYYAGLCAYAGSLTGDSGMAEDLVQDVFVNVWMKRAELTFDESLRSYLYRAVHNASLQVLRRQKLTDRYDAHFNVKHFNVKMVEAECIPIEWVSTDTDVVETNEIHSLYQKALEQLSAQTREIFSCSREKDMKYSEIAALTGLSVKSVEYHVSKALDVLRMVLKDYLE